MSLAIMHEIQQASRVNLADTAEQDILAVINEKPRRKAEIDALVDAPNTTITDKLRGLIKKNLLSSRKVGTTNWYLTSKHSNVVFHDIHWRVVSTMIGRPQMTNAQITKACELKHSDVHQALKTLIRDSIVCRHGNHYRVIVTNPVYYHDLPSD